jgi:hypothetical protein
MINVPHCGIGCQAFFAPPLKNVISIQLRVVWGIKELGNAYEVVVGRLGETDRIKLKVELMPDAIDQQK